MSRGSPAPEQVAQITSAACRSSFSVALTHRFSLASSVLLSSPCDSRSWKSAVISGRPWIWRTCAGTIFQSVAEGRITPARGWNLNTDMADEYASASRSWHVSWLEIQGVSKILHSLSIDPGVLHSERLRIGPCEPSSRVDSIRPDGISFPWRQSHAEGRQGGEKS